MQGRRTSAGDRRPIRSRESALIQRCADRLIARGVRPNTISIVGLFAGIAAGGALAATALDALERPAFLAAAALVQLRLLCNLFDGMVAIGQGSGTPTGELYNEVPDRVSDTAVFVGLGYAVGGAPALGYAAALAAMSTAYVRAVGGAAGAGSDFGGPMAKPQRMFLVTLCALYLGVAPRSWQPQLMGAGLPAIVLAVVAVGALATAALRLRRIAAELHGARP